MKSFCWQKWYLCLWAGQSVNVCNVSVCWTEKNLSAALHWYASTSGGATWGPENFAHQPATVEGRLCPCQATREEHVNKLLPKPLKLLKLTLSQWCYIFPHSRVHSPPVYQWDRLRRWENTHVRETWISFLGTEISPNQSATARTALSKC